MPLRPLILPLAVLLTVPVTVLAQDDASVPASEAEEAPSIEGRWDLRIDGTSVFSFTIAQSETGEWQGRWSRPARFNTDGNAFANLGGGVHTTQSMTGNLFIDAVELAFDDPRPGAVPDIFHFRLVGDDAVEMVYVGTDLAPYRLVRAEAGDPLGNWEAELIYRRRTAALAPSPAPAATPAPAPPIDPATPRTVTIGPQVRFLDLTPRPAPAGEDAVTAAGQDAAPAEPGTEEASDQAGEPDPLGDDFLEGL